MDDDSSDDGFHARGHSSAKSTDSSFRLDDAFTDDDEDESLEFTPASVREELARTYGKEDSQVTHVEIEGFAAKIGLPVDRTADSPSTGGIESPVPEPLYSPSQVTSPLSSLPSQEGSFYEVELSDDISQLALSKETPPTEDQDTQSSNAQPSVSSESSVHSDEDIAAVHEEEAIQGLPQRPASPDTVRSHSVTPTPRSSASVASTSSSQIHTASSLPTPPPIVQSHSAPSNNHRRAVRSIGPSTLDKVISKTRPHFLPPKSRTEDKKHQADWEQMMKRSRAAEEKRRQALQQRRYAREKKIEDSIGIWEREIVPDWTIVNRDPNLRKLWWEGIPTKLRATMWKNAVGNSLVLSKDTYKTCLSRAKRALAHGTFPTTALGLVEEDIETTLPSLHLFMPGVGPLYEDLKDMLCAWVVSRSDEGLGYVVGIAKVAAMLLLNMASQEAFVVMRNLLERHCLRSFYGGINSKDDVEAYYRIFDTLLADGMPKVYFNFKQHQVSPAAYLPDWIIPLFLDHLPFEACARLWDILLLEGDPFLYRAALAMLGVLEPRLFFPDRRELLELLWGENKAAIEIAKREGRQLNGAKYEIYGLDEETLWERLDSMDEWWRENTWTRLIQRELPDL